MGDGHLDASLVAELPAFAVYATGAFGGVPLVALRVFEGVLSAAACSSQWSRCPYRCEGAVPE